jgi:hypothetical protein
MKEDYTKLNLIEQSILAILLKSYNILQKCVYDI